MYHFLVEDFFFSFSEAGSLKLNLSDLGMKTSNVNKCLSMLQKHLLNTKKWLLWLMAAVFSQYCESGAMYA